MNLIYHRWPSTLFGKQQKYFLSNNIRLIYTIPRRSIHFEDGDFQDLDSNENILSDFFYYNRLTDLSPKKVIVILPRQRFGELRKSSEQCQSLLDETVTLAKSIPYWSVTSAHMISSSATKSKKIFGSTNLQYFKKYVDEKSVDAVVFATDILRPIQHHFFKDLLNIEIYDRFSVVLKIFRERCHTKEAKLQLALAELHYVQKNLRNMTESDFEQFSLSKSFGNFDTFYQVKKQILEDQEIRLKKRLSSIENNYELKRQNRTVMEIPSVAIVGYTNSGKTSLIKALTHDSSLKPEDRFFATLDVTTHQMTLPSKMKALLIDTIGFISDIPTKLVHCFQSTLKEITKADLIIHVVDASHPDKDIQIKTVHDTLKEIQVPEKLLDTMIEVWNKVDKVSDVDQLIADKDEKIVAISTTERIGLNELVMKIQKGIIQNTDRLAFELRVPNGGEKYQWLYKEASSVVECKSCEEDANFIIMKVILTKSKFGKFVKLFYKEHK